MTAVSQSYPNYLGGLNEQPDEAKKPGQLSQALNVIPDPVIGLSRRPGFELIPWSEDMDIDSEGTWFELELSNQVNNDYIYFGCVHKDGTVTIFNQDGEKQKIKYSKESIIPHKNYKFKNDVVTVRDDDNKKLQEITVADLGALGYFKHIPQEPLKYCVSKQHVVFTNPTEIPTLAKGQKVTNNDGIRYYSFINLKVIDTANYNYTFKRWYANNNLEKYKYIRDLDIDDVDGLDDDDWEKDLSLPLQTQSPFTMEIDGPGVTDPAIVEVNFVGQIYQFKSDDGDGYPTRAKYSYSVDLIYAGKGFKENKSYKKKPCVCR